MALRGKLGKRLGGLALRADNLADRGGLGLELPDGRAGGVAGQDDGLGEGVGLFAALVVGERKNTSGASGNRERVDKARDVAAERLRCRSDAAKRVFELTALLEKDRQR